MKITFLFAAILALYISAGKRHDPGPARLQLSGPYYFSENGDDTNDGKSIHTPWRSLEKAASMGTLQPGDSILLERGSTFSGTLTVQGNGWKNSEIYIGPYGDGAKPRIDGSVPVTGWKKSGENIWVAPCEPCRTGLADLYINDKKQPLGRYPDTGYRKITRTSKTRFSLEDTTLPHRDHFWDGAEVVVKSSRWTIDHLRVQHYTGNTFQFLQPASDEPGEGYGYFIQDHLMTLDAHGEWYFDRVTNRIFLFFTTNPANEMVEVSISGFGLKIFDSEFVRTENISVTRHGTAGVTVTRSNHVTLTNLDISGSGANGLVVTGCKSPTVRNTAIRGSHNNGVVWGDNADGQFVNNSITATGLVPGRGASGNGSYIALSITAGNPLAGRNTISDNRIDSVGYSGIDFRTGHTNISNNLIRNFCMIKDDGGGIYTWNNAHGDNIIEGNVILNGTGSGEGTPDHDQLYANGIYIDDRSSNMGIEGNTVAFCASAGIFIHNSRGLAIDRNRLYGNGNHPTNTERAQLVIRRDHLVPADDKALDLSVRENILVATDDVSACVYFSGEKAQDLEDPGSFLGNQYRSPEPSNAVARHYRSGDGCHAPQHLTLPQWQASAATDEGASFARLAIGLPHGRGKNLIANGTITEGTGGWMMWPERGAIIHDKDVRADPSLRAEVPEGGEALVYHAGFPLSHKKLYRLSFSMKTASPARVECVFLAATSPWNALSRYTCFATDTTFRTFTWYFRPQKSLGEARLNLKSNATLWVDNITLQEIPVSAEEADAVRLIYNLSPVTRDFTLQETFSDMDGRTLRGKLTVGAYSSEILIKPD